MSQTSSLPYDLFIVYAPSDQSWVEGYLLPGLNVPEERIRRTANFTLGAPLAAEYQQAVTQSCYTLLILSPAYLADTWSEFGALLSTTLSIEEQERRVIPLYLKPCQPDLSIRYLVSLDCTEPEQWSTALGRLHALLNQPVVPPVKIACPYPGMSAFREDDNAHFYGRDAEIKELLECLRLYPFLAIIGPSGSGKSSLAQAGLLPALRQSSWFGAGDWLALVVRPGATPYTNLCNAVGGYFDLETGQRRAEPNQRICLLIDQFEEVFSLNGTHRRTALSEKAPDDKASTEVAAFAQGLLRLIQQPNLYIVLTMRDDFYGKMMGSALRDEFKAHHVDIPPLQGDGLRQAILQPAQDVGVYIEDALVERLLAESSDQPGALPFIQETLVLLWERLERRYLPIRAYEALVSARDKANQPTNHNLSGIQIAMAHRADAALAELTKPADKLIAQRIFMRLIQFGEGRADTRRQQTADELNANGDDSATVERVIAHFVQCRLLTASGEQHIDMAHEKLIEGWPALQGWIKELKAAEQVRRRLEAKAAEYQYLAGKGGLLDQVELTEAEEWLKTPAASALGCSERLLGFVKASKLAINPGWHRWGTIELLATAIALIALLGFIILRTEELSSSTLRLATRLATITVTALMLLLSGLLYRADRYRGQHLSQMIAKSRIWQVAVGLLTVGVAVLWIRNGIGYAKTVITCSNLGYTKSELGQKHIALKIDQLDPYLANLLKEGLESHNEIKTWIVEPQNISTCAMYFTKIITIKQSVPTSQEISVFATENNQLIASATRQDMVDCSMVVELANKITRVIGVNSPDITEEDFRQQKNNETGILTCQPFELNKEGYTIYEMGDKEQTKVDRAKKFLEAEQKLRKAVEIAPNFAIAYRNLGLVYSELGQYAKAVDELTRSAELLPNFPPTRNDLAWACSRLNNYDCAIQNYNKVVEIVDRIGADPTYERLKVYNNLSILYRERKAYSQAKEMIERARQLLHTVIQKDERVYYEAALNKNLGIIQFNEGSWNVAIETLQKANQIPTNFEEEIVFYLASSYQNLSDRDKACQFWLYYGQIPEGGFDGELDRRSKAQITMRKLNCKTD
ncbi:MAG: TIR domain-containing protein [Caldilineaceae bacterium]